MPDVSADPTGAGSSLNATLAQAAPAALAQSQQNKQDYRRAVETEIVPQLKEETQRAGELRPPPPPVASPPPKPQYTDPLQAWGSLAMGVAMLGSAFTRQPVTNALNAGAAVNNAYHKGDLEASRQALDTWKAQTGYAQKLFEYQDKTYRDALANIRQDRAGTLAELRVLATAYKDDGLLEILKYGQIGLIGPHLDLLTSQNDEAKTRQSTAQLELNNKISRLDLNNQYQAAVAAGDTAKAEGIKHQMEFLNFSEGKGVAASEAGWQILNDPSKKDAQGNPTQYRYNTRTGEATTLDMQPYSPGGAQKLGTSSQGPPDPKTVEYTAQAIANYRLAPMSGWTLRSPFGQQVMARVMEVNPDYEAPKYAARVRGEVAFTSGRQADAIRAFSVSIDHLATLEGIGKALQTGDVQALNRMQARVKQEFGYEGPVDFNFAKAIVGDEVSKAVIGGVGSQTDRTTLQEGFSTANSPEQLVGVATTAKRLIAGQLAGYRRQYERGTGEKDFDDLISTTAKRELSGLAPAGGVDAGEFSKATLDDLLKAIDNPNLTNDQRRAIDARLKELGH